MFICKFYYICKCLFPSNLRNNQKPRQSIQYLLCEFLIYTCGWIWEKLVSTHIYKIMFWKYIILEKEKMCLHECLSSLIYSYKIDQLCKRQLVELPTILDIFYTSFTSDYIKAEFWMVGRHIFPSVQAEHCNIVLLNALLSSRLS